MIGKGDRRGHDGKGGAMTEAMTMWGSLDEINKFSDDRPNKINKCGHKYSDSELNFL